jgi:hypothetical protein
VDGSIPAGAGNHFDEATLHLLEAHFHPFGTGPTMTGGLTTVSNLGNMQMFDASGGVHNSGNTLTLKDFFVHERNLKEETPEGALGAAVKREFTLVLSPIPEPSSFLLMVLGSVGLVWRRWTRAVVR